MFRPKARKSDQVQMHLLPPRCCFALAALVWPATEASLTIRTALGTVDLGLLQQPNSQQAHHLRTCLAVGKQGDHFSAAMCHVLSADKRSCLCLEHVTIKLWTLQQNKTHIYNHIYIYIYYIWIYLRSKLQYSHGVPWSCLKLVQSVAQMLQGLCLYNDDK